MKKKIRRLGALVVLGIFTASMLAQPVAAINWDTEGNGYVGNDGADRIYFDNTNGEIEMLAADVGIGTTSPGAKLDVRGSAVFNADKGYHDFRIAGKTDDYLLWADAADDRIGIGTQYPTAKLDVRGTAIFNDGSGDYDFRIEGDTDANLFFLDAGNDRIGIGVDDPAEKLEVDGNILLNNGADRKIYVEGYPTAYGATGYDLTIHAGAASPHLVDGYDGGALHLTGGSGEGGATPPWPYGGHVYIYGGGGTNSLNGYVILAHDGSTTRGRVGIGTTSPSEILDVNGKLHMRDNIKLNGNWLSNDGDDEGIYVTTGGQIGIKESSPTADLDIDGNKIRIQIKTGGMTSSSDGYTGEIVWDEDYIWVCTEGNGPGAPADTWKKAELL
ncbi:MAG: hypothetical protein JSV56_09210 [Methanomassiliicoccales archaeon]|nr:MAG: hypothetical protein JSV56_09210 [Methanomassiliicoccales archaeon]